MARSRNLKPGFFTNEVLGALPPLARLLFEGMWCHADREGRLEDRLIRLKPQVLPYDECDIEELAQGLHDAGMILRYVVDGKRYIQIINFLKHQNPHVKEQPSIIPAPDLHHANTSVAGLIPSSLIPSSSPPDSLSPIKALSGKPKINGVESREILDFLNETAGKRFRPSKTNLDFIRHRLEDGITCDQLRKVIVRQSRAWLPDDKMRQYLRPSTLFNRTNCEQYIGELVPANEEKHEL